MTSLDVLATTEFPFLHLCLFLAFLFFSFSHLKLIIVPVLQKQVDEEVLVEDFEPEDTFEEVDVTALVDVEKTSAAPIVTTPTAPVVTIPVETPKPEAKKNKKKKNKKKKPVAPVQIKAPASPSTYNLSDDESSVGPSFGSDVENSNSKASPPPSPVKALPVTPPSPPDHTLPAVAVTQPANLVVTPEAVPVVKKSAKVNEKSALLRRIAAQLRLRVRNKSKGFNIDYTTFAIIPSTVNIPFGCKVAESEFFRHPFDENAPISPVQPQNRIQQQEVSEQDFSNHMNLSSSSPSSLKAFAPVFVPKQAPTPNTMLSIRPLAFERQQQPHLLATPQPRQPQPQQMSPEEMATLLETQMNDDQMEPPENTGEGGGEISECIPVLCKYGNSCSRAGCHFMHSMRPSVIRKCKYDNLCIRSDCHFSHPNGRPLLKAKPRTLARRPKQEQNNQSNSLGLPPRDLAARVMSLAALGYNVSQHLQQPAQHVQRNVMNRHIPTIRSC
jgi:hypothetical protein